MKFGYDNPILDIAPSLVAGVVWCAGINNTALIADINARLTAAEFLVNEQYLEPAEIARNPAISAWREVYSRLGLTPNRYQCAAESLIRRVVSGKAAPRISPLVDLCNAVSLQHAIPVAPIDLHLVEGDVIVRLATGSEVYRPIGSSDLQPIPEHEAVYADNTSEVLSRRWNWRQTGKSAIRPNTTGVLITTEAVHVDGRQAVDAVLADLTSSIEKHLGGNVGSDALTHKTPWSEQN